MLTTGQISEVVLQLGGRMFKKRPWRCTWSDAWRRRVGWLAVGDQFHSPWASLAKSISKEWVAMPLFILVGKLLHVFLVMLLSLLSSNLEMKERLNREYVHVL
jgi:RsiW-degrading membrane proteinase PrsW (M82 family)